MIVDLYEKQEKLRALEKKKAIWRELSTHGDPTVRDYIINIRPIGSRLLWAAASIYGSVPSRYKDLPLKNVFTFTKERLVKEKGTGQVAVDEYLEICNICGITNN